MIRYVIIALGDLNETPEEKDLEAVKEFIDRTGLLGTILSERASRALTLSLVGEAINSSRR